MELRDWYWRRQGLDDSLAKESAAGILATSGWARSVGGVGPYLSLYARCGILPSVIDRAVAGLEVHELPAARGCTYVVPAAHFALALECARAAGDGEMATAMKLGVTVREVERLETAVCDALREGPLDPAAITERCGDRVRSLGEAGKKKGLNSTLPVALGRLQIAGVLRRVPANGRLDNQRYRYTLWNLPLPKRPAEDAFTDLARLYFGWTGPATLAEFQWFSGLGVKKAQAAVAPLGLQAFDAERWMLPGAPAAAKRDTKVVLLSSLDALFLLRRNVNDFIDPADLDVAREMLSGGLTDLSCHAIVRGGRLIGLWEYDPGKEEIAWMTFGKRDAAIIRAVEETAAMIRTELEDARSFSLDSPKSRQPRIDWLRRQTQ
ncbi:MAG: winged helix DNA-binding domain-containing protein [Bryobacteraceae bacterium]|nr:winged helix DNA-binding domain-containing protein [Bryobacteraceae bacterium]